MVRAMPWSTWSSGAWRASLAGDLLQQRAEFGREPLRVPDLGGLHPEDTHTHEAAALVQVSQAVIPVGSGLPYDTPSRGTTGAPEPAVRTLPSAHRALKPLSKAGPRRASTEPRDVRGLSVRRAVERRSAQPSAPHRGLSYGRPGIRVPPGLGHGDERYSDQGHGRDRAACGGRAGPALHPAVRVGGHVVDPARVAVRRGRERGEGEAGEGIGLHLPGEGGVSGVLVQVDAEVTRDPE